MKCKICNKDVKGRSDKKFCSLRCKNYYHLNLRKVTAIAVKDIDIILHRNRAILLEVVGKNLMQKKIERIVLERKKFNFKYNTHSYINSKNKTLFWVYDFGWMSFSDDEILIVRKRTLIQNGFPND
tara:strand:- start:14690 stop:15067 length:378 start_codon:yes stop_codon:yes gene_type:complete